MIVLIYDILFGFIDFIMPSELGSSSSGYRIERQGRGPPAQRVMAQPVPHRSGVCMD